MAFTGLFRCASHPVRGQSPASFVKVIDFIKWPCRASFESRYIPYKFISFLYIEITLKFSLREPHLRADTFRKTKNKKASDFSLAFFLQFYYILYLRFCFYLPRSRSNADICSAESEISSFCTLPVTYGCFLLNSTATTPIILFRFE